MWTTGIEQERDGDAADPGVAAQGCEDDERKPGRDDEQRDLDQPPRGRGGLEAQAPGECVGEPASGKHGRAQVQVGGIGRHGGKSSVICRDRRPGGRPAGFRAARA